jgi:hypothetical protein
MQPSRKPASDSQDVKNILSTNYLPKLNKILADNATVKGDVLYLKLCGNPSVLHLERSMCPIKAGTPELLGHPAYHQTELFLSNGQCFLLPRATTVKVISQNDQLRYDKRMPCCILHGTLRIPSIHFRSRNGLTKN